MSKRCEGFPEAACPDGAGAVYDMLGYQLCERCADQWRTADQQVRTELREQLASAHEAIGQAITLIRDGHTDAALSVLYDALRRQHDDAR